MPTSAQAAGERRVNALLKLLKLRSKWEGYRDYFLLILFSAYQMAGYSNEDSVRLTLEANTELEPSLSEREVRSLLSTAMKKHYKMKNAYIITALDLTADEQTAIGISVVPTGAKSGAKIRRGMRVPLRSGGRKTVRSCGFISSAGASVPSQKGEPLL